MEIPTLLATSDEFTIWDNLDGFVDIVDGEQTIRVTMDKSILKKLVVQLSRTL
jgi:hypothetical protein